MATASDDASSGTAAGSLLAAVEATPLIVEAARDHRCAAGTHSRLADGRIVCWSPPGRPQGSYAVDAEITSQPVPPHLERRWRGQWGPHESFWEAWCASEVCAKLLDIPIVVLAARGPVAASPVRVDGQDVVYAVGRHDDLTVAFGLLTT